MKYPMKYPMKHPMKYPMKCPMKCPMKWPMEYKLHKKVPNTLPNEIPNEVPNDPPNEPNRPTSRAEPNRAERSRAEPSRAEPSGSEPSRAEPSRERAHTGWGKTVAFQVWHHNMPFSQMGDAGARLFIHRAEPSRTEPRYLEVSNEVLHLGTVAPGALPPTPHALTHFTRGDVFFVGLLTSLVLRLDVM